MIQEFSKKQEIDYFYQVFLLQFQEYLPNRQNADTLLDIQKICFPFIDLYSKQPQDILFASIRNIFAIIRILIFLTNFLFKIFKKLRNFELQIIYSIQLNFHFIIFLLTKSQKVIIWTLLLKF